MMMWIKATGVLMVLFLLFQRSEQQACPGTTTSLTCVVTGSDCIKNIDPADIDGNGQPLDGSNIILTTPGTYRLNATATLLKATCITGSTSTPGSYILKMDSASTGVNHFEVTGCNSFLSLQGVTVQGDLAANKGGIYMPCPLGSSAQLNLSSVVYQDNTSPVKAVASNFDSDCIQLFIADTSFLGNSNSGNGGALLIQNAALANPNTACATVTFAGDNK